MPRMTRARAAEVASQLHTDGDATVSQEHDASVDEPASHDRPPLRELMNHITKSHSTIDRVLDAPKEPSDPSARNPNMGTNSSQQDTHGHVASKLKEIVCDDGMPPSPAKMRAADDLMQDHREDSTTHEPHLPRGAQDIEADEAHSTSSTAVVTATRNLLAAISTSPHHAKPGRTPQDHGKKRKCITKTTRSPAMSATIYRTRSRSPVRLSTPQSQKSFRTVDSGYEPGSASYDELEAAAVEAQSSPPQSAKALTRPVFTQEIVETLPIVETPSKTETSPKIDTSSPIPPPSHVESPVAEAHVDSRTPSKSSQEDAFHALDLLEEVEQIAADLPDVQPSPEKHKTKRAGPIVRTTKASQARISLAHGPKDAPRAPALGRPRVSLPMNESPARRVVSNASSASHDSTGSVVVRKEVIIPHSKPRPMSMAFPPPPPPARSTKAPTQSTFQLPGDIVAAKFRAAKEARLAKEAEEEQKRKSFKARPVPAGLLTKAPAVRQTSSSIARETLMTSKPTLDERPNGHQRAGSFMAIHERPPTSMRVSRQESSTSPKLTARPSTAMSFLTKVREPASSAPAAAAAASVRPPSVARSNHSNSGTSKGKEAFNRPAQIKAAEEQAKREKEEATKRARAEAAERSRQLSREWAEKQRQKKLHAPTSRADTPANALSL